VAEHAFGDVRLNLQAREAGAASAPKIVKREGADAELGKSLRTLRQAARS
jgi:hypothetical protein